MANRIAWMDSINVLWKNSQREYAARLRENNKNGCSTLRHEPV
jgi:hypothetical protein